MLSPLTCLRKNPTHSLFLLCLHEHLRRYPPYPGCQRNTPPIKDVCVMRGRAGVEKTTLTLLLTDHYQHDYGHLGIFHYFYVFKMFSTSRNDTSSVTIHVKRFKGQETCSLLKTNKQTLVI